MKKTFKSIICLVLAVMFLFVLTACGALSNGSGNENGGNGGNGENSGNNGGGANPGKNAYIETIKSDWNNLAVGSQAHDRWYSDKNYYEYKFDKDGKCVYYRTYYNFPDASKYEEANERLESGNWKPTWADDKSYFYTSSAYISYLNPQKAIENFDEKYIAYTIIYSDNTTKTVSTPDAAQKAADLRTYLGITIDTFNIAPATNPQIIEQNKYAIKVDLDCEGAAEDELNQYAKSFFASIKSIADENKVYDYIDYSVELLECPQIGSIFESVYFMYRYKDNKFNVCVGQNENKLYVIIQIYK